jgi:hypothetical protein
MGCERPLPAGRYVSLPGRGITFVRELSGPDNAAPTADVAARLVSDRRPQLIRLLRRSRGELQRRRRRPPWPRARHAVRRAVSPRRVRRRRRALIDVLGIVVAVG